MLLEMPKEIIVIDEMNAFCFLKRNINSVDFHFFFFFGRRSEREEGGREWNGKIKAS